MQISLLASTPDIAATGYMVNLLLGTPGLLAAEARELGYDGIEFFPGPPGTVGVAEMDRALEASDVVLTAVNSGRIVAEGLTLLHLDPAIRSRALTRLLGGGCGRLGSADKRSGLRDDAGHPPAPSEDGGISPISGTC